MVEGKKPGDMPGVLRETFTKTIEESRANPPSLVGSGYYALMELGEFVPSRIVEAVVHGFDLTDALGSDTIATPDGVAFTAGDPGRAARAGERWLGGPATCRTTSRGCGRRRAGPRTTTRASRSSADAQPGVRCRTIRTCSFAVSLLTQGADGSASPVSGLTLDCPPTRSHS